ncbi:hypothetical protein [Stenoxybacter acetivorans]|nr:hypothetical protein [Stenoxybacter acetivorans]
MKITACFALALSLLLAACASGTGTAQNELYGEISAGYETSHTKISR